MRRIKEGEKGEMQGVSQGELREEMEVLAFAVRPPVCTHIYTHARWHLFLLFLLPSFLLLPPFFAPPPPNLPTSSGDRISFSALGVQLIRIVT